MGAYSNTKEAFVNADKMLHIMPISCESFNNHIVDYVI